jgi:biotin operon repressor
MPSLEAAVRAVLSLDVPHAAKVAALWLLGSEMTYPELADAIPCSADRARKLIRILRAKGLEINTIPRGGQKYPRLKLTGGGSFLTGAKVTLPGNADKTPHLNPTFPSPGSENFLATSSSSLQAQVPVGVATPAAHRAVLFNSREDSPKENLIEELNRSMSSLGSNPGFQFRKNPCGIQVD